MRVLAFRHSPRVDTGHVPSVLEARGIAVEAVDLYRNIGFAPPDTCTADGLIFMGGTMSANDDLPYLQQEIRIIAHALERDQPVFGVCLGSQMMARALGARVYPNPVKEIGWYDIDLTEAGTRDPLFGGLPRRQVVFQWHGDTFDLPHGAELLASSAACRHQAFRFGRAAYGVQFHAEVTAAMIEEWCLEDANCGTPELIAPIDAALHAQAMQQLSIRLFGSWADLL